MPIPSAACADDISGDVCCDTIWLIGDRIRTVACSGLFSCFLPDCADREFRSFTTIGERIEDPLGESLIVSHTRSRVVALNRSGMMLPVTATRSRFRVELREMGFPTGHVQGETIYAPDSSLVNAASKHVVGHAEKMWRALVAGVASNTLFPPATNPHIIQGGVTLGDLTPRDPEGPMTTYYLDVDVEHSLP